MTTEPFDPDYLQYWIDQGYSLPHLIAAGPYAPEHCLSSLILAKSDIQDQIHSLLGGGPSRLEVFKPNPPELKLAEVLGVKPYFNQAFVAQYGNKSTFKALCESLGIPGLPYLDVTPGLSWDEIVAHFADFDGVPTLPGFLAKSVHGTGGIALGGMHKLEGPADLAKLIGASYYIEPLVDLAGEVSTHWEIHENGDIQVHGIYEQLAENASYVGVTYPFECPPQDQELLKNMTQKLSGELGALGGLGFMCCDVLKTSDGQLFWSDFNPRKGAASFVAVAVQRHVALQGKNYGFKHKHLSGFNKGSSFADVEAKLGKLLTPSESGFVLVTNPGVIPYGGLDITAISYGGKADAEALFETALGKLHS